MRNYQTYSKVATLIMAAFAVWLILTACNPYNRLANRPPLTTKDSALLLARCIKIIPPDNKTPDSIQTLVASTIDSTQYYKLKSDSLLSVKQRIKDSIAVIFKDSCKDVNDAFESGFNLGYEVGFDNGKQNSMLLHNKQLRMADSICAEKVKNVQQNNYNFYNLKIAALENAVSLAQKDSSKYRNKSDFWKTAFIWSAGFAALFLILCILLWKFRRQAKAANSIINSGQDIIDNVKNLK